MEVCQQGRFSCRTNPLLFKDIFSLEHCSVRLPPRSALSESLLQPVHPPLVPNTCTLLTDTVSHFRGQSLTLPCVGDSKAFACTTGGFQL